MKRLLVTLLCTVVCSSSHAGETWVLYHAPGADAKALYQVALSVTPPGTTVISQALPATCKSADDLKIQRSAMSAGVHVLPCLALQDERGCYAVLPLRGLSARGVHTARELARAPRRAELAAQRLLAADLYFDIACARLPFIPMHEKTAAMAHLRRLAESETLSVKTRQFIVLHCLYSSLMCMYAAEYSGAHTTTSEQLFLQAIAALEIARDMDASSEIGRLAHQEREKLRAARLQAKKID